MSLLAIGTVAFDDIQTPFGHAEKTIGGAGTYIALAASYFHQPINLSGIIGYDFPEEVLEDLNKRGIVTSGVERIMDKKSFFWAGKYSDNMNSRETLVTELNVLEDFDPKLDEVYKNSDYIMLGNLTPEIQGSILQQANKPKFVAMDTMNFWMDVAWDALHKVIPEVDVLIINDEEARQLSGEYSLSIAADKILDLGLENLIIKKGEHGALLFHKNSEVFFAPALPLAKVKDPTGAGDTFAGGFMGYLSKTDDLSFENMKRAVIYGSTMASFCVEEFSIDKLKNLDQATIEQRAQEFVKLVQFEL